MRRHLAGTGGAAVADLALRLVQATSLSGEEKRAASVLAEAMRGLGYRVNTGDGGEVIGELEFGPGPTVLLDGHLDTVPVPDPSEWSRSAQGEIADGRLYGRGAVDMKGALAACVLGVASLRGRHRHGRVVVCGSVGEELIEGPSLAGVARRIAPDHVVICEPSGGRVMTGQRGRAEISVRVGGRAAHSAYPEAGCNAVEVMADVVRELRDVPAPRHPVLGEGALVLIDIVSRPYPSLSTVPDLCTATFDRRTLPGESEADVLAPVRAVAAAVAARYGASAQVEIAAHRHTAYTGTVIEAPKFAPAWTVPDDDHAVAAVLRGLAAAGLPAVRAHYAFCTNGSGSAGTLGLPTIGYGPGEENAAHTVDESIRLDDLAAAATGYPAIVRALTEPQSHSRAKDDI